MRITGSAISLTVDDVSASSKFLATHFGFSQRMAADGFATLGHPDTGLEIVFLRTGLEVLPPGLRPVRAGGA